MKWVPDKTGRFSQRPHYSPEDLDAECENIISTFLLKKYGLVVYPVTTNDLTVLIEENADLDLFADLSDEGDDVEGLTAFRSGERPIVRISSSFGEQTYKENRLRTTLTHEYGHVHFHQFLFDGMKRSLPMFSETTESQINRCHRHTMINAQATDWLEWQAGYACGALLMPVTALSNVVRQLSRDWGIPCHDVGAASNEGVKLIENVAARFEVSKDAARVRLIKRGVVVDGIGPGMEDLLP